MPDISDKQFKVWLEERIIRLEMFRYELNSLKERIDEIDEEAVEHNRELHREEERIQLRETYSAKYEEMRAAFVPTASSPFIPAVEMKVYCQTLMEVNERLKHQEKPPAPQQYVPHAPPQNPLRALYGTDTEPPKERKKPKQSR